MCASVQGCEYLDYFDFFPSDYDKRPLMRVQGHIRNDTPISDAVIAQQTKLQLDNENKYQT